MDSPLAELDAWWASRLREDEDSDTVLLRFGIERAEAAHVEFATVGGTDTAALEEAEWRLDIAGIENFVWRNGWGEPKWFDDHILLWPYDPQGALISFSKPFRDPLRAWGAVEKAHAALVGGWFPLGRFLAGSFEWEFGQLASGPERLLAAYADALRSVGEEFGLVPHDQSGWAKDPPPSVVTWGRSYFVARSFRLERLA